MHKTNTMIKITRVKKELDFKVMPTDYLKTLITDKPRIIFIERSRRQTWMRVERPRLTNVKIDNITEPATISTMWEQSHSKLNQPQRYEVKKKADIKNRLATQLYFQYFCLFVVRMPFITPN